MLWSAFKAQLRRELEEGTAVVWSDDSLLHWANEGIKDIAIQTRCMRDWQYTSAVVGQASYSLPVRTLEMIRVFFGSSATVGNREPLTRIDFSDLDAVDESNGTPTRYIVDDENLYLYPPPLYAYEISMFRYTHPAALTADGDSMPYSDKYNTAIVYFVRCKAKEQTEDWEGANVMFDRYLREIDRIQSQVMKEAHSDRYMMPAQAW